MISIDAFVDELEKIAAESSGYEDSVPISNLPPNEQIVTPSRLKRAIIAAGVIGAGTGVGTALGRLIERNVMKSNWKDLPAVRKYAPTAAGMFAGLGGLLIHEQRRRADEYIAHGPKKEAPHG